MNSEKSVFQKLLGRHGYGPGVFEKDEESEVERALLELEALIEEQGMSDEAAELVLAISRHVEHGSFTTLNGGEQSGERISGLAAGLSRLRGQAHLWHLARPYGFEVAKQATLSAVSSGRALMAVEKQVKLRGSPALKNIVNQLDDNLRKELVNILAKEAKAYWANFPQTDEVDVWPDDMSGRQSESSSIPKPVTTRQREVLEYIERYIDRHEYAPTVEEIKGAIGVASNATVYEHLEQLEARGYLIREPYKTRAIKLIRRTERTSPNGMSRASDRALEQAKQEVQKASSYQRAHEALLLSQILTRVRARNISLYKLDKLENKLKPEVWLGCWQNGETPRSFSLGQGIAGWVWENKKPYVSKGNVQEDENFERSDKPRSQSVCSLLVIPIFDFDDHFIGLINLDSNTENRFDEQLKKKIEQLTLRINHAIRKSGLAEEIEYWDPIEVFLWVLNNVIRQHYMSLEKATAPPM